MRAALISTAGCCAALSAFLGFAPAALSQETEQERESHTEHVHHELRFVKITGTNIRPEVFRIGPRKSIGWLYYGTSTARVSFDEKVAESVTCRTPGSFELEGDRIQSRPLKHYEFASFCKLKPGEYDYRVVLGGGPKVMTAKVIVE